jgi:FHS family L-fucose permease-like MFS transporter
MPIESLAPYVALFWASLMIGRWTGTAAMVKQGFGGLSVQVSQWIMRLILPSAAFGVFLLVTYLGGHSPWEYVAYSPALLILILADAWSGGKADRQLALYSVMGMVALLYGMLAPPATGVYALIAVGLCCSTLWPCIFALAVKDMGSATTKVSSALIMMIMGGGFVSVFGRFSCIGYSRILCGWNCLLCVFGLLRLGFEPSRFTSFLNAWPCMLTCNGLEGLGH